VTFNQDRKPTWDVEVRFVLKNGTRTGSDWTIVASSAQTACQRGVRGAIRTMTKDKVKGRNKIRSFTVYASPESER
jgi:hypothetical protein